MLGSQEKSSLCEKGLNPQLAGKVCTGGRPRIDRIVIRYVQYQFEVHRCKNEEFIVKGNVGWAWVGNGAMHINRCRNEEVIVKGNFGWAWSMCPGAPQVKIDRIVIRDIQYQFEVNRCRNEEVTVKGNFRWAWSMWAGRPRIDRIVIRDVQYQFEVNRCRNEEVYEIVARTDGQTDRQTDRRRR
ncbi:hypothetical protein DPMN_133278 [Dreissena polymorpha]|uniref:Uncharacterized protein n=1 Tax=Dreissena polymorpha TaxID=45954 RepID=A0A9D4FXM5_DREPO|nr:hypothetical protein DPMN_133278 [Dreissena polymorpha]